MVYSDWELIDNGGHSLGLVRTLDYDPHLLMRTNYINASLMYRRECQDHVGLYDERYLHVEDWEYWLRIAREFPMLRVPEVLYQYRVHEGTLTERKVVVSEDLTKGQRRLARLLMSRRMSWMISKLKWELLRWRMAGDPRRKIQPNIWGRDPSA